MGEVYKIIFETTRALKPDSVTQSCPCGTPPSLAWFRYMDQAVTADPISSLQVRRRMMMSAAGSPRRDLRRPCELPASSIPIHPKRSNWGWISLQVVGDWRCAWHEIHFVGIPQAISVCFLRPEKETYWKKWIGIYNEKMLSKGDFLDLYTYGYDAPEAYAIQKDGNMFYAFYSSNESPPLPTKIDARNVWKGEVELRGIKSRPLPIGGLRP